MRRKDEVPCYHRGQISPPVFANIARFRANKTLTPQDSTSLFSVVKNLSRTYFLDGVQYYESDGFRLTIFQRSESLGFDLLFTGNPLPHKNWIQVSHETHETYGVFFLFKYHSMDVCNDSWRPGLRGHAGRTAVHVNWTA